MLVILLGVLAGLVLIVGGLSAVLLLRGKGGGHDGTTTSTTNANSGDASGRLRLAGGDPITLDPALAGDALSAEYIVEIFGGLVTLTPDLKLQLDLAESVDTSTDGKVYTFKLRENAAFQSGRRVTAEDVRYSIERAASKELASSTAVAYLGDIVGMKEKYFGQAKEIAGLKVIDDRTIQFTIDAPKPYFLAKLTYPTAFVVDKDQVQSNPKNWTRKPNGTGPYQLREWRLGERITLEANKRYHLGAPKVQQVVYELSGGSALTRYESGELDVASISISDIDRARDPNSKLNKEYKVFPQLTISYIAFNTKTPPFDDVNVRKALALSIDRKKISEVTFNNMLAPATGVLPPQLPGYTKDDKTYPFNAEEAKKALAASKYRDAKGLPPITITEVGGGAEGQVDTQAFIQQWHDILGIDVKIQQTDFATFLADQDAGRLQMFNAGWIVDYPDPENILELKFHSGSTLNDINYQNPEADRLLDQARTERDTERRLALYQQVEKLVVTDVAWIPLYFAQAHEVINPRVQGWVEPPIILPRLRFVSLTK